MLNAKIHTFKGVITREVINILMRTFFWKLSRSNFFIKLQCVKFSMAVEEGAINYVQFEKNQFKHSVLLYKAM